MKKSVYRPKAIKQSKARQKNSRAGSAAMKKNASSAMIRENFGDVLRALSQE